MPIISLLGELESSAQKTDRWARGEDVVWRDDFQRKDKPLTISDLYESAVADCAYNVFRGRMRRRAERNLIIKELIDYGWKEWEIARMLNVDENTIYGSRRITQYQWSEPK